MGREQIQSLIQQPDGSPSERVRALIDESHKLTVERNEALAALLPLAQGWAEMAGALPEYHPEFREAQPVLDGGGT